MWGEYWHHGEIEVSGVKVVFYTACEANLGHHVIMFGIVIESFFRPDSWTL